MAESSIAKAYVQIIPSAEGIKGKLSSILGSEATSAGKSAGQSSGNALVAGLKSALGSASKVVGTAFKAAATAGVAGLGAASAGIAAFSKKALDAYADYEQLVGGVETLFGDAAGTVMQYADQAFQSAGLSANDYMETVTSFSASLLQSLNNDTGKAAEYANQALVDMSDNANKMGSNMQDIQNAYQGFAKQNYTMLDNLKLGYGGTKEEMERLIEDANKLKKANGETADLSISSFADIVEAIHLVQTEMGITGTTAKEASTTIQGSVSAMKAAWTNLMVGVADDTQDFDQLMDNFVSSAATAASNILPRLETILTGTGQLITKMAPIITAAMPVLVQAVLPAMIEAGVSLISAFAGSIISSGPALVQTAMDAIQTVLTNGLGLSDRTANGIMGVLQSLLEGCQTIFTGIGDAFGAVRDTVNTIMADAGITWTDVWNGIAAGISAAAAIISGVITGVADAIAWVVEEARTDGTVLNDVWTVISDAVSAAWAVIQTAISAIGDAVSWLATQFATEGTTINLAWNSLKTAIANIGAGISAVIDGIVAVFDFLVSDTEEGSGLFSNAWQLAADLFGSVVLVISEAVNAIADIIGWLVTEATTDGTLINAAWTNISTSFTTAVNVISDVFGAFVALFQGDFDGFMLGLVDATETFLGGVETEWDTTWNAIKTNLGPILDDLVADAKSAWNTMKENASSTWDSMKENAASAWNTMKENASSTWDSMKENAASAWDTMKNNASTSWNAIKSNTSAIWSGIKAVISGDTSGISSDTLAKFDRIKTGMSSSLTSAKNSVLNIFSGIKDGIANKIEAARLAVHNAIEAIKEKFNFSWSLPKLKLPHITISGSFSLVPPSAPSFGISWYARAMNTPVLLRSATIFGAAGGNLLGGGEAGDEVVSGAKTLMGMIRGAVGGELSGSTSALEAKLDRLIALLARMTGVTINVNGTDYRSKMELAEAIMELLERDYERQEAAL